VGGWYHQVISVLVGRSWVARAMSMSPMKARRAVLVQLWLM
jgi:hypothetical protein